VCYVWDLSENEVIIYDSLLCEVAANSSIGVHSDVVSKLGVTMDQCKKNFDGWEQSWLNPNFQFFSPIGDGPPR
jgi:hypothetical protein